MERTYHHGSQLAGVILILIGAALLLGGLLSLIGL